MKHKRAVITDTDKEDILDIIEHDGIKVLLKILTRYVENMEKDVLSCDLNTKSFAHLAVAKSKAEGARLLLNRTQAELDRVASLSAKE